MGHELIVPSLAVCAKRDSVSLMALSNCMKS